MFDAPPPNELELSELHVVSDLHLGGAAPGSQIFKEGTRLAALIRGLRRRPTESLALVLNGDIVDFLAEEGASVFDPAGAIGKLWRIINDPSFSDVWAALRELVAGGGAGVARTLVFVLGNHDIELALPHVRQWLSNWLAAGDDGARGRILWATEGAGFTALVGGRRVLCLHGNEVDDWNLVDHLALLQTARAYHRGMPAPTWRSNAGSSLVVDVMNPIKRAYPFVDLLKPEVEAAVPLLFALKPSLVKSIGRAAALVGRKWIDGLRASAGFLGEGASEAVEVKAEDSGEARVRELVLQLSGTALPLTGLQARMEAVQLRIERGEQAPASDEEASRFLGGDGAVFGIANPMELLRSALKRALPDDRSFEVSAADDTFRSLDAQVGSHVHFLIAGHTHLRRALPRQGEGCFYYNTGTWIRLIRLSPAALADKQAFERLFRVLGSPSLLELDAHRNEDGTPFVHTEPTVASIVGSARGTYGVLNGVQPDGSLESIEGTRFPREVSLGQL
ncbi:MAG: phosphoesterase [Myxococcales bacterium]|nr:MAG: phosphoesterase [Myxococcales bacterium]